MSTDSEDHSSRCVIIAVNRVLQLTITSHLDIRTYRCGCQLSDRMIDDLSICVELKSPS